MPCALYRILIKQCFLINSTELQQAVAAMNDCMYKQSAPACRGALFIGSTACIIVA